MNSAITPQEAYSRLSDGRLETMFLHVCDRVIERAKQQGIIEEDATPSDMIFVYKICFMIALSRLSLHVPVGENVYTDFNGQKSLNETTGWKLTPGAKSLHDQLFKLFSSPENAAESNP